MSRRLKLVLWLFGVLVAVAVLLVVTVGVTLRSYSMPSPSMGPTIPAGARFVVAKPPYWFGGSPERGDIVVFKDPGGWLSQDSGSGLLTKRVIGIPGDTIHCCNADGRIEINGRAIDEGSFLHPDAAAKCNAEMFGGPLKKGTALAGPCDWTAGPVPAGSLFVMGDNRTDSADSRTHLCPHGARACPTSGWVREDDVVGKVEALRPSFFHLVRLRRPSAYDDVPSP